MVPLSILMVNLILLIKQIYGGLTVGITEMFLILNIDINHKINHIILQSMVVKDVVMENTTLDMKLIPENHSLNVNKLK